jgi:hypothetical protein
MSKAKNDILELEEQIKVIDKEYHTLIAQVSRSPQHMSLNKFLNLNDIDHRQLIRSEIDYYCERDKKINEKLKEIEEIRTLHKETCDV